jgi:hypothetical protein
MHGANRFLLPLICFSISFTLSKYFNYFLSLLCRPYLFKSVELYTLVLIEWYLLVPFTSPICLKLFSFHITLFY